LVGGLIVTHATWPWIFYVNLPLGILALVAALWLVPKGREASVRRFDAKGFVLLAGACVAVLGGLEWLGNQTSETLIPGFVLVATGTLLAAWAVRHCRQHAEPFA